MILWFVLRPKIVNDGQSVFFFLTSRTRPRRTNDAIGNWAKGPEDIERRFVCFAFRQIGSNRQKPRRAWSGSSMILWFVMLERKRFRLGKTDDLDYLFRIGWVTRQSQ